MSECVIEGENPKTDIARFGGHGSGLDACASVTTALEILVLQLPLPEVGRMQEKNEVSADKPDPKEQTRGRGDRSAYTSSTLLHLGPSSVCSCREHHLSDSTIKGGMAQD